MIRFKAYIEALGNDKDLLKKFLSEVENKLKEYKEIVIKDSKIAEAVEKEIEENNKKIKLWSSYLEMLAETERIDNLIDFILWYSPSRIEIEDIKEIKIFTKEGEEKITKEKFNMILNQISSRIIELSRLINSLMITNSILYQILEKYAPKELEKLKKS